MRVIGFEVNHKNVDFMWLFRILNTLSFYIHGIKHGIKNNVLIEEYTITISVQCVVKYSNDFLNRMKLPFF